MRLVILFDMLINPSFKMTTSLANVARTTASTRLMSISKGITNLIFLNVWTPPQHALTLCFKIIDKADSKFDLKIKEALHINLRKPN